jgi:hypothetical protein
MMIGLKVKVKTGIYTFQPNEKAYLYMFVRDSSPFTPTNPSNDT